MVSLKKIDDVANLWEKTKDPKYKDLWYKYIKEYTNGINNSNRRDVSSSPSHKTNDERNRNNGSSKLF
jgi:hypothetical protein